VKSGVAVEKLIPAKFAKIKSRQEAAQSIFSGRVDIFYPPNFGCLRRKGSFSTPTGFFVKLLLQDPTKWPFSRMSRPELWTITVDS
jgi:hypothetical protein